MCALNRQVREIQPSGVVESNPLIQINSNVDLITYKTPRVSIKRGGHPIRPPSLPPLLQQNAGHHAGNVQQQAKTALGACPNERMCASVGSENFVLRLGNTSKRSATTRENHFIWHEICVSAHVNRSILLVVAIILMKSEYYFADLRR